MKAEYILSSLLIGFLWGISPIIQKRLLKRFDKISLMLIFSLIYFLMLLLTAVFYQNTIVKDFNAFSRQDIFIIIAYVTFTIFLTNILILEVLKNHDSHIVAALEGTSPLFTLLVVYLFFDENITRVGALGVLFIVFGIVLIAFNDSLLPILHFYTFAHLKRPFY
jgi:drug/metabolite transporter (DMT)-like permease